ncbi:MAG: NAD-dependent epimerase/dehydratase family protein [Candidatus Eisenbacteria bacterium]
MKILVTGGTGFTGAALVRRLLDEGHEVTALDNKEGLASDSLRARGARIVLGSVTDPIAVREAMRGARIVHHLAAAFREMNVPEAHYAAVNVEGTRNVLEEAAREGVEKFVYCSTCGVHGDVADPPANEDAPIAPADYYQRTKYLAEPIVQEHAARGMRTTILRPAAIYGPGDPERFYMIFRRVARGSFPLFGSCRTFYHPLYIDNLVDAFLLVQEPGRGDGRTYLIADRRYYTIEEIVRKVAAALEVDVRLPRYPLAPLIVAGHVVAAVCRPFGVTPPIFPRRVDWYRQNRAFDIGRAVAELGYDPKIELDEGLRRTAAWYRERRLL